MICEGGGYDKIKSIGFRYHSEEAGRMNRLSGCLKKQEMIQKEFNRDWIGEGAPSEILAMIILETGRKTPWQYEKECTVHI